MYFMKLKALTRYFVRIFHNTPLKRKLETSVCKLYLENIYIPSLQEVKGKSRVKLRVKV